MSLNTYEQKQNLVEQVFLKHHNRFDQKFQLLKKKVSTYMLVL